MIHGGFQGNCWHLQELTVFPYTQPIKMLKATSSIGKKPCLKLTNVTAQLNVKLSIALYWWCCVMQWCDCVAAIHHMISCRSSTARIWCQCCSTSCPVTRSGATSLASPRSPAPWSNCTSRCARSLPSTSTATTSSPRATSPRGSSACCATTLPVVSEIHRPRLWWSFGHTRQTGCFVIGSSVKRHARSSTTSWWLLYAATGQLTSSTHWQVSEMHF